MNFLQKKKTLGVVCNDGLNWHAARFDFKEGVWSGGEVLSETAVGGRAIPVALMTHLSGVGRVRVLIPNELRLLPLLLPEELSAEEVQGVITNALFDEFDPAIPVRFTVARADLYGMTHDDSVLSVSPFELRRMARFQKDLESAELRLDAVGALESALLDWHGRMHPAERLLFVGRHASMYAVPESASTPFVLVEYPLGMEAPTAETRERMERVLLRINSHSSSTLHVVLMEGICSSQRLWLEQELGRVAEWHDFSEIRAEVLSGAVRGLAGETEAPIALVGPPPKPRDPHFSGTLFCGAILLLSCLFSCLQWHGLLVELQAGRSRQVDWEMLQTARMAAGAQLKRVTERQTQLQHKAQLLSPGQHWMPLGLMPVLESLGRESTTYSRITSISQQEDSFEIHGITLWQTEVSRINAALQQVAEREQLIHSMKEMSDSDEQVQYFEFVVQPQGDR
jgi:hypothetical protein